MIRLSIYNPIPPIHLLQQDHPHQLMGKRHFGKAQCIIRSSEHFLPQPDGAADHECDAALPLNSEGIDLIGELL